ncbi:chemotaxis protein CheA [Anaerocolumna cellulosilytica]|uniref:Chemotaxis protein CheA n=1 Tax=Anaerocolumna cellulosilytica TaxID=433286 RepID=A0A6S6RA06_9FIRM|nr:chemotaxis protein CheA [Anaerocolumna cellulosilytica]MBB5196591.1 two-component system chemotaxis sensor kinase CheA [Anaerocolumna cellulosilytica]BCJ95691.1 chemotaxis protein CheA [Anaerocolumna cellulosilytica]
MSEQYSNDALLESFIYETIQLTEQLEQTVIASEGKGGFLPEEINKVFRIMHTIKGSASMMRFQDISTLAHTIEDVFFILRENSSTKSGDSLLCDLLLDSVDFIKSELEKIENDMRADGSSSEIITALKKYLTSIKKNQRDAVTHKNTVNSENHTTQFVQSSTKKVSNFGQDVKEEGNRFEVVIYFEENCGMEHVRAYGIVHALKDMVHSITYLPENIGTDASIEAIQANGFRIDLTSNLGYHALHHLLMSTVFLKELKLKQLNKSANEDNGSHISDVLNETELTEEKNETEIRVKKKERTAYHSMISVSVAKLDKLMDLMGELVITEAAVLKKLDIEEMTLDIFHKSARQLSKITSDLQDIVMAIRMLPLSVTFHKMNRVVRDMSKKLEKEVNLILVGEDTEVDKNIIEHISDPLMHLVRNALDHGIENPEERVSLGKTAIGTITLKAENSGSEVLITIKDDGRGLNKDKILTKAKKTGLLDKRESNLTDKEIYKLILLPGFSTKEKSTEFSGRGVGMDVVMKNLETIGGSLGVESRAGEGTTITLKIPLTLAVMEGMNLSVGDSNYIIPINVIKESFHPKEEDIIFHPNGNDMIRIRSKLYPILSLHKIFNVRANALNYSEGILIMVSRDEKSACLFADHLTGQQQVVVRALPEYIQEASERKILEGCTLLSDGRISLILDIPGLIS